MCTKTKTVPGHWHPDSTEVSLIQHLGGYCYLLIKQLPQKDGESARLRPAIILQPTTKFEWFRDLMIREGITPPPLSVRFLDTEEDILAQGLPLVILNQIKQVFDKPEKLATALEATQNS